MANKNEEIFKMQSSYFFGYGSLVNIETHVYRPYQKATAKGWRRKWVYTKYRKTPFLSAHFVDMGEISGLLAMVPNNDWDALDIRETGYQRQRFSAETGEPFSNEAQIYFVPDKNISKRKSSGGILLSYLDCVIKGYLSQFGEEGAADFFSTTDGWDCNIFNDRLNPIYPRHVELSDAEYRFVDHHLKFIKS